MRLKIFSYRFALEILEHPRHGACWSEIIQFTQNAPLFIYPNKSSNNNRLDVVQQLMNTYFDRIFSVDNNWEYHPLATDIRESRLAADFKKNFGEINVQAEVQFGNMARWYSDIFKFQTAYSQGLINIGLCIVPTIRLASRIDSNITNFERVIRELPSAKLSITLPILVIGIEPDENTSLIDVSNSGFNIKEITGKHKTENRFRIINGFMNNMDMTTIDENSDIGPIPNTIIEDREDLENEEEED